MPQLRESTTAVVARGERFRSGDATEPYEAGWAVEAVVFLLGMDAGEVGRAVVQISPDGINWTDEGTAIAMPSENQVTFGRVGHFGNWIRIVSDLPDGAVRRLHITFNFKG
ncbi:MAG: hypothetical protein HQ495_04575 [Alphaproteobacteria bacterium]|nr:hypothetical protein [Alphaproteobacteria bacterium]